MIFLRRSRAAHQRHGKVSAGAQGRYMGLVGRIKHPAYALARGQWPPTNVAVSVCTDTMILVSVIVFYRRQPSPDEATTVTSANCGVLYSRRAEIR